MKLKIPKQLIKTDQLILILSLGYLGLLFAGRADWDIWLLVTHALIAGKIAQLSFHKIQDAKGRNPALRDRLIPKDEKKNLTLWLYGLIASAIFIFLSFLINELSYYLSVLSVVLLIGFLLLKRYASLPGYNLQFFEAFCPIGGFIAANNRFEFIPFILGASILFWTAGLEISRAIYETQNDKKNKNFFISRLGAEKARVISVIFFLFSLSMLILAGISAGRGIAYWITLFCFAIILARQEYLLNSKDVETAKTEFLQINNFVAPLLLIGTLIDVFYR